MTDPKTAPILPNFKKAFQSENFISDARRFLTVGDEEFAQILGRLQNSHAILGPSHLREEIVNSGVSDDNTVQLLLRIVPVFARWGRTVAHGKIESFVATLHVALRDEFEGAELAKLAERLKSILQGHFPALVRADKVDLVVHSTGRTLRSVQLISDVRPVFDESRERIIAVVPMTTLQLTADSVEDGVPPLTCEAHLSEQDLLDLSQKVAEAQQKLAVMKKVLCEKQIEIADCAMVMGDGEGE